MGVIHIQSAADTAAVTNMWISLVHLVTTLLYISGTQGWINDYSDDTLLGRLGHR